jgi:hypothetical protein
VDDVFILGIQNASNPAAINASVPPQPGHSLAE